MANQTATEKILEIKVKYDDAISAIAKYQTEIDKLKEHEKELKKERDAGRMSQEKYNAEMAKSKADRQQYAEAIRVVSKEVQNERRQQTELEGSMRSLRAELSNLTAEYDSLSRAERNTAKGKELEEKINAITDELKGAEKETQRFYRNVGNYEDTVKNVLGLNNSFADSLFQLQERAKKGNIFGQLRLEAQAFGKTLLGLLTNPVFLALAGIAGVAFKWFYDYNKGLVEATRLTKQFTGLGGDELKAYRNEVQVLADTYGKEFTEVLRGANSLSKQFGISQQEALGLIKDGFIAGADASGEFMDILREYPAYFKEAGISAEEFVAITTNATQQGIFSDKGIDAIKEANTRLREMTTATADALDGIGISSQQVQADLQSGATTTWKVMQQVADKLNELPESSAQVGTVIADIFGGPGEDAGLAYLKTLGDIDLNLDNLKNKTGELGEAQEELIESQLNLQNALSGLADMTGGDFERMEAAAKSFLNNGLANIINGVRDAIDWFKELYAESMAFRAMIQYIALPFQLAFHTISTLLGKLLEDFKLGGKIIKAVFTLDWDTAKEGFAQYKKNMLNNVKDMAKDVKDIFKEAYSEVVNPEIDEQPTQASDVVQQDSANGQSKRSTQELQATIDAKKKELEEIRKAEDEMLAVVKDSREKQRKQIELSYDREIEDLKERLATEKDLTAAARTAINTQITALEQQKSDALQKLSDDEMRQELENRQRLISLQLEVVRKGSEQEYQLKMEQLAAARDAELSDKELTETMKLAIVAKYQKLETDLVEQHDVANLKRKKKIIEMQQELSKDASDYNLQLTLDRLELEKEIELSNIELTEEEKLLIIEKYAKLRKDAISKNNDIELKMLIEQQRKEYKEYKEAGASQYQLQILQDYHLIEQKKKKGATIEEINNAEIDMYEHLMNQYIDSTGKMGESNEAFAKLSKTLALAQIAIESGKAIAAGITMAMSVPFPANLAAIASTIATILANIATAKKMVQGAKFAQGGLVTGPGSETSDSIPARLSNGESVMTAAATQMFAPILSSFNQMGGGVPINVVNAGNQTIGEDMLARAVARGMMMAPAPVVSIEEFTSVANRVKYVENLGSV